MSNIPHDQDYTLVYRSCSHLINPEEDPDHAGFTTGVAGFYEGRVAVSGLLPAPETEGEITEMGNGRLWGMVDNRQALIASPKDHYVMNAMSIVDPIRPPFAMWDYLVRVVWARPNDLIWLYAAYKIGTNPGAGMIPRSRMTREWDGTQYVITITDDYFDPILPMLVVIDGAVVPSRSDNGLVKIPDYRMLSAAGFE